MQMTNNHLCLAAQILEHSYVFTELRIRAMNIFMIFFCKNKRESLKLLYIVSDNTSCEFRAYTHFLPSSNTLSPVCLFNSSVGTDAVERTVLSPVNRFLVTLISMAKRAEAEERQTEKQLIFFFLIKRVYPAP